MKKPDLPRIYKLRNTGHLSGRHAMGRSRWHHDLSALQPGLRTEEDRTQEGGHSQQEGERS